MDKVDVVVIGAGPAGLSAAITVSRAGHSVLLIEQRETVGGAIFRQSIDAASRTPLSRAARRRWQGLEEAYRSAGIPVMHSAVFLGVDGDGRVLVEDRKTACVKQIAASCVILAVGAVEKILPRPGWQLPGVMTAGGLQLVMKETGKVLPGRTLLVGNGPLLLAVAAQMCNLGNPPIAVCDAGDPVGRFTQAVPLALHPGLLSEAMSYMAVLALHRVTWLRGASLASIERRDNALSASLTDKAGRVTTFTVDRICLHDGIAPNDIGLPAQSQVNKSAPLVFHAGDCREALGAAAAIVDGRRVGRDVVACLAGSNAGHDQEMSRWRRAQAILSNLFEPVGNTAQLARLPDETVLCRCENRTIGDLKSLMRRGGDLDGREIKHNGRFAMGACQGRFCAANTAALVKALDVERPDMQPIDLTGRRWPIRPIPIQSLINGDKTTPPVPPDMTNEG